MLRDNWPGHCEKRRSAALAAELRLRPDMEEGKVACDEMMCDACSLIQDVNLPGEHVLGLFVGVLWDVACGTSLDAVEARGQVGRVVLGLGLDAARWSGYLGLEWSGGEEERGFRMDVRWSNDVRVEVCDDSALTLWNGDVFVACAFDDCERYGFLRHCQAVSVHETSPGWTATASLTVGGGCVWSLSVKLGDFGTGIACYKDFRSRYNICHKIGVFAIIPSIDVLVAHCDLLSPP